MKKTLLILFALPFLLSAQNVTVNAMKESSFVKQMIKSKKAENSVFVYSAVGNNLPDSIYTYDGEEKNLYSKAAFTYDDAGRVLQEKGVEQIYYGENSSREYKKEYSYTQDGNNIMTEEIYSIIDNGEWVYFEKLVTVYNSENTYTPMEYNTFDYIEDGWVIDYKYTAVELDDKNRPVAYIDSTFEKSFYSGDVDTSVMRIEVSYNELGQDSLYTTFHMNEVVLKEIDEWVPLQQIEIVYNENNKFLKQISYEYDYEDEVEDVDWIYEYTVDFEYDEKGNVISEIVSSDEYGMFGAIYYTNIYSISNANDVIFSVKSNIYPNPVSDVLFVSIEGVDKAILTLVNAAGGVVAQQTVSGSVAEIPVQSFAKGNYFLIIKTNQGTKTHKIIIK